MSKLIKLLKEVLKEAKQVGTLYHFTDYKAALEIIKDSFKLKTVSSPTDGYSKDTPDYLKYISFSRDRNLKSPTISRNVRFKIDGDSLSNKYKIEPFADVKAGFGRRKSDESEERVNVAKQNGYVDISNYLESIEIMDPEDEKEMGTAIKEMNMKYYNELISLLDSKGIKYNLVKKYL